jgi:hypothetical protein
MESTYMDNLMQSGMAVIRYSVAVKFHDLEPRARDSAKL